MLQLIAWMGCVYLLIKGIELLSHQGYKRDDGELQVLAGVGAGIAIFTAVVFAVLAFAQGQSFARPSAELDTSNSEVRSDTYNAPITSRPDKSEAWHRCVADAKDGEEAVKCSTVK